MRSVGADFEFEEDALDNSIYEAFIPEEATKLGTSSSQEDRMRFIKKKYELQDFLKPSL